MVISTQEFNQGYPTSEPVVLIFPIYASPFINKCALILSMAYIAVVLGLMSLLSLYATGYPMRFAFAAAVAVVIMISGLLHNKPKKRKKRKH